VSASDHPVSTVSWPCKIAGLTGGDAR